MIDFVAALAVQLEHEPVDASQRIAGDPRTGFTDIGRFDGADYGVWEMTPGTMSDVEDDELFIVLRGSGTVTFESGESLELVPGTVGTLEAGMRTEWTVTSMLRKVYIAGRS